MGKVSDDKPGKNSYRYPWNKMQKVLICIIKPLYRLLLRKIEKDPCQYEDHNGKQNQQYN